MGLLLALRLGLRYAPLIAQTFRTARQAWAERQRRRAFMQPVVIRPARPVPLPEHHAGV
jgi:hypothetical protein